MKRQDEVALSQASNRKHHHHLPVKSILKPHARISDQQYAIKRDEAYVNKAYSEIDLNKIEQQNNPHRRSGSYDSNLVVGNHLKHSITAVTFLSNNNNNNQSNRDLPIRNEASAEVMPENSASYSNIHVNKQEFGDNNSGYVFSSEELANARKQYYQLNGVELDEINL
jgi:hypothetical protein